MHFHTIFILEAPWLDILPEVPAFLCDRVSIECDVRRSADMTVVDDIRRQRRNMLYLSRGQLKKHSNTSFNICVSVRYISQQVNILEIIIFLYILNVFFHLFKKLFAIFQNIIHFVKNKMVRLNLNILTWMKKGPVALLISEFPIF